MSVADDLRAAKALIDTPEKFERQDSSIIQALGVVTPSGRDAYDRAKRALAALVDGDGDKFRPPFDVLLEYETLPPSHADIMSLFDRAIAAASVASHV